MDTFEIGDKVVYPNHGVGIIEKISNRLVAGKFERFYLLRICSNDILVMVPTANASDVGLRKIIDRRDVEQLLSFLSSNQFFTQKDWKIASRKIRRKCAPVRFSMLPKFSRIWCISVGLSHCHSARS